jgi:phage gpG-like protein
VDGTRSGIGGLNVSLKITGITETFKNLEKYEKNKTAKVQGVIDLTAQLVRSDAISSMQKTPKSGNIYKRGSKVHTASSSPNPPAIDGGRLVNSVRALVGKMEAFVGTNVAYGRHLEFGTSRNLNPRPWLFPAFERQRRNFLARIKQAMAGL